uniref:Uncharacterized protein n=1 Tax=Steinernema glaseri TaxID=37863 RepID=A0A1I7YIG2_9BILA
MEVAIKKRDDPGASMGKQRGWRFHLQQFGNNCAVLSLWPTGFKSDNQAARPEGRGEKQRHKTLGYSTASRWD